MTVDDLFGTERCPVGVLCESCGVAGRKLAAVSAATSLGVLCLTLCGRCGSAGTARPMSASATVRLVAEHCGHLGITVDDMADVLEVGR